MRSTPWVIIVKLGAFFLLDGSVGDEENSDSETAPNEAETRIPRFHESEDTPEVSLHAISGTLVPQTIRVKGSIGKQPVVMLIDSGRSKNRKENRGGYRQRRHLGSHGGEWREAHQCRLL